MRLAALALLGWLLGGEARAQEPAPVEVAEDALPVALPDPFASPDDLPWAVGLPVSQVVLEAPEGGLPRENLEPLLRVTQGSACTPRELREDVALLLRVGSFSAVEVWVEPWVAFDDDGEPIQAVNVIYRVFPSPRISRIEVTGATGAARRTVDRAVGLARGEAFYPAEEAPQVEARVSEALVAAGWPEARVRLTAAEEGDGAVRVRLDVEAGTPALIGDVALGGDVPVPERRLRRWLRRAGIVSGRPLTADALTAGRQATLDGLVADGWLEARVNVLLAPLGAEDTTWPVSVLIDAGPRTELHVSGRGFPSQARLREVIGLTAGDRVARTSEEELTERISEWFQGRGFFDAQIEVAIEDEGDVVHLDVAGRRGRRHALGKIKVEGASAFSDSYVAAAIREAAPDTLGEGIITRVAADDALDVVEDFYRSQGFLSARLSVLDITPVRGSVGPIRTMLRVAVDEGPRTTLGSLRSVGGVVPAGLGAAAAAVGGGLEGPILVKARAELVGQPFNPSSLEVLSRRVVEAYREQGYLNADARVETSYDRTDPDNPVAESRLLVTSGQQVRLRSVIVEGNRRTRRPVITRELRVTVGEPVTPEQIAQSRAALYDLDLFSVVSPDLVGDDDRSRDLVVHVEEKPNILLEVGGGLSTDEGVSATTRATHRNLGGLGQRVSALGEAGLAWAGDEWAINTTDPVWKAALRYEAPYVPARGLRLVAEVLLNEAVQEPTYRLVRSGASVGLKARLGQKIEGFVDYHLQLRQLEDADPGALVQGEPWWPASAGDTPPDTPTDRRVQGGLGVTFLYDQRDDRFNPTRGSLLTSQLEFGHYGSLSANFGKAQLRFEQLVPVGPITLDLVGVGGAGAVAGRRATQAVEDRFTLGGSSSLRGFRQDRVGPANHVTRPDIDYPAGLEDLVDATSLRDSASHYVPTGGDAIVAGTVELRVPLVVLGLDFDSTSLVLFSDVGTTGFIEPTIITDSRSEGSDPLLRVGAGAGVRIATPVGPLAIDLGINVSPIDARDEPRLVPHLALGAL